MDIVVGITMEQKEMRLSKNYSGSMAQIYQKIVQGDCMNAPTFVELFAGIGGFRLGLERAGWKCIWANEIDKNACKLYRKNFGGKELIEQDIRKIKTSEIPEADMLVGGFPCQPFSLAGSRKGFKDTFGTLFYEIARIAEINRPKILLLENVKGLLSAQRGQCFYRILQILDELGYDVEWQVLNSKYYGVPQTRERVFIIGYLRGGSQRPIFLEGKKFTIVDEMDRFKQNLAGTLTANYDSKFNDTYLKNENGYRCFTPVECERLQGFPDRWTEGIPDKLRYKCLGNAVTVNVIEFLGKLLLRV